MLICTIEQSDCGGGNKPTSINSFIDEVHELGLGDCSMMNRITADKIKDLDTEKYFHEIKGTFKRWFLREIWIQDGRAVTSFRGELTRRSEFTPVPPKGSIFVYIMPPQNVMPAHVTPA